MKCITPYCRNEARKGRKICSKCWMRIYKERYPEAYFFNLLRCNAKRRGKEFTLTIEQFKDFCNKTGYLEDKGKNGNSMSIDRIDSEKGYTIDNIRILTLSNNTAKERNKYKIDNCPF
jgi:hypothetical protein